MLMATSPAIDQRVDLLPAAQVEIAHAEIGPIGHMQRLLERRQKRVLNGIEDARHSEPIKQDEESYLTSIAWMKRMSRQNEIALLRIIVHWLIDGLWAKG